eukprot:3616940-Rhodomonas_salina.1
MPTDTQTQTDRQRGPPVDGVSSSPSTPSITGFEFAAPLPFVCAYASACGAEAVERRLTRQTRLEVRRRGVRQGVRSVEAPRRDVARCCSAKETCCCCCQPCGSAMG